MKHVLPFLILPLAVANAGTFSFDHENVLGTSMELRISAGSETTAKQAEATVLAEIDRLSAVLNTWSSKSEISRWIASGKTAPVSADLDAVLKACDHWTANSQGAFSIHVKPDPKDITVDALAKGYIIDKAVEKAVGGVDSISLNIGGDLRTTGTETISVADPRNAAENATPLTKVTLHDQSMATSGGAANATVGARNRAKMAKEFIRPLSRESATIHSRTARSPLPCEMP